MTSPSKESWLSKTLLSLFTFFLGLLVVESFLRIFFPHTLDLTLAEQLEQAENIQKDMEKQSTTLKLFDPLFHHSTNPNRSMEGILEGHPYKFSTNNLGCRDLVDYEKDKPPNTFRVILTGDSFTAGLYVDDRETYSYYLQETLKKSFAAKGWQIYNFGNTSYSPLLYWQQYTHTLTQYHPDLLILAIDNSDLQDDYYYEQDAIFDQEENLQGFKDVHYSFFLGQIRSAGTPEERVEAIKKRMASRHQSILTWATSHFQIAAHIRDFINRSSFQIGDIASDRYGHMREGVDWSSAWKRTEKYLLKTVQAAKKDGVPVLILFYPYPNQVNGTDWPHQKDMGFKMGKIYDTPLRKWLSDFAQENDVGYLDTFESFRQSHIQPLSFQGDPHYLPEGHQLLARVLSDYLTSHYNLPKSARDSKPAVPDRDRKDG